MPNLIVSFTKMEGAGNDFVVLDNRFYRFTYPELQQLAARWCDRRRGIGADGLLALDPVAPEDASTTDFRMRYVNADGSHATMCGNGARCLARFAYEAGIGDSRLVFETDAGRYAADVPDAADAPVRLWVPAPSRYEANCSLHDAHEHPLTWHQIWSGTEHVVAFTDHLDDQPLATIAPPVRHNEAFAPEGTNVNLAYVEDDQTLRMRTYEKGVEAETLACGTGVVGTAAVALKQRHVSAPVTVHTPGGTFEVGPASDPEAPAPWYLDGPARAVYQGTFEHVPQG
ncbi:MAG: diaminopimelate epimerase [Longimonas sp.]|uniref:diaminopimelate epimerase n=1 Tax=Longimonas sp. TaxID=2039626 RepID=UPI003359C0CD